MSTDALLQRALDEIVRQREELAEFRARDHTRVDMHAPEPIAIVGLGCRFPGQSDSPAAYWMGHARCRSRAGRTMTRQRRQCAVHIVCVVVGFSRRLIPSTPRSSVSRRAKPV